MRLFKKSAVARALLLGGASGWIVVFAQPALAQSDSTAAGTNVQDQGLADIVVTAQRREQSLQKVPISVAALSSEMIRSSGITNTESLQVAVPSLTVTRITASTQFFIRGVGTAGGQAGQEGAVATFLDGVYLPSMNSSTFALGNVERIEVLKGPQGTLYGRNATAGAVNVISRDPKAAPEMQFDIGYGNLETVEASTYATMGIATNLAVDFTAYYLNQNEGFGRNIALDNDTNKRRDIALSSKLLFDDDSNRASLYAGYTKSSGSLGMAQRPIGTTIGFLTGAPGWNYGFYDINSDVDQRSSVETKVFIADLQRDFGAFSLKSISGYVDSDSFQAGDLDLQPLPVIAFPLTQTDKQFTQELQIASSSDSNISWIGGLYFLSSSSTYHPYKITGLGLAPAQSQVTYARQKTKSYAIYGQATLPVSDRFNVTVGGRYTIDKRTLLANSKLIFPDGSSVPAFADQNRSETYKEPTWRLALDYTVAHDVMLYASYSRGFKSGLFNLTSPPDPAVQPENLDAFEAGVKSTVLDHTLMLNAAGFYYKYNNIQLTKIEGTVQNLLNAAKARVYGAEAEFQWQPVRALKLNGGLTYLNAKYGTFEGAPFQFPSSTFPFGNATVDCAANPAACDASGNRMIRAPKFTANAGFDAVVPTKIGDIKANLTYYYNGGFFWQSDNRLKQGSYSIVNSQVKWTGKDDVMTVRLWVNNLMDKKYYLSQQSFFTGDLGTAAPGRTYGVSIGAHF